MSETLMVWRPQPWLTQENVHETYVAIAEEKIKLPDDPILHEFLADVFLECPPLETGSEKSPWSVTPEVKDGHIAFGVSGDIITTTCDLVDPALPRNLIVYHAEINKLYDTAWDEAVKREVLENRRRAGEID